MAVLRTITTALAVGSLALFTPTAAAPTTAQQGTSSSQVTPEIIEKQAAYWSNKFILDPVTNATIPNPAYADNSVLAKRKSFNPPNGAECRVSAQHYYYPKLTCSSGHGCEDDSYETEELRIVNHQNTGTNYAVFSMEKDEEQYFQLDGHRGWFGAASWDIYQWYGLSWAYGRIEGRGGNRGEYLPYLTYLSIQNVVNGS